MEGIVTKLFDIDNIVFPEQMFQITVDEKAIDEKIALLSLKYAKESEVSVVEENDVVYCQADKESYPDGRIIILYPSLRLPMAEEASSKVIGKKVDDEIETELAGKIVRLTIKRVVRRIPVDLTDEIIASMGIEQVNSLSDYKEYLKQQEVAELESQQARSASQYALSVLIENSEYLYNRADMESYVQAQLDQYAKECEKFGMEMDLNMVRNGAMNQVKQSWVAKAYCDKNGIQIDEAGLEEQIDEMMQMQALMGVESMDRDTCVAMFMENQYLAKLFEALNLTIQKKMEK